MNVFDNPGRVFIAGDWHGNINWARSILCEATSLYPDVRVLLHLGDLGIWGSSPFLEDLNQLLETLDLYLLLTGGNHEDWPVLNSWEPYPDFEGAFAPSKDSRIILLGRPAPWVWNDVTYLSLGGAASIDFTKRTAGVDWFEGEAITDAEVAEAIKMGSADIMLAHDVPSGVGLLPSHRDSGQGWGVINESYAKESRDQLKKVTDVVRPQLYFHGHYHMYQDEDHVLRVEGEYEHYAMTVVCFDKEYTANNLAVFDTTSLTLAFL